MIVLICILVLLAVYIIGKAAGRSGAKYRNKRFDIGKHRKKRLKDFKEEDDDD